MEFDWRNINNRNDGFNYLNNNQENHYIQRIRELEERNEFLENEITRLNNNNNIIQFNINELNQFANPEELLNDADEILAQIPEINQQQNEEQIPGNIGQEICEEILSTVEDNKQDMQNQAYMNVMQKLMEIFHRQ